MTRFLYIADTHLGAAPMGYQMQKGYPEHLPQIISALRQQLSANSGVDFILHGGDMVDSAAEENIAAAAKAFDLPVPVYLCLGNHDLTAPDAIERWLNLAPRFFPNGSPDYTIESGGCVIHVAPNHWCDKPFFWKDEQRPHFSPAQIKSLSRELSSHPDLPHIILTHCPVYGLPVEQTGLSEPYHAPDASFTECVAGLAASHPNLKCVLGAHNHMNMHISRDCVEFVTTSSLVETPFEMKLFEVTARKMKMSTFPLRTRLDFSSEYDKTRSFVQGRAVDRSFINELLAEQ